jgi:hypothetical protein
VNSGLYKKVKENGVHKVPITISNTNTINITIITITITITIIITITTTITSQGLSPGLCKLARSNPYERCTTHHRRVMLR